MGTTLPLAGKVAVVAGATRGAGPGIAHMLGAAGAIVYCTGRSTRGQTATPGRPESIEETAELVTQAGGKGIAVQADHTMPAQVQMLFEQVRREQGRLDVLVNDIWGGDALTEWGTPFWELNLENGLQMQQQAVYAHIITSRYGVPLMIAQNSGLIVEVTDGDFDGYRGSLFYDLAKSSAIRLAYAMSCELIAHRVTALAVTPGFLRSEAVLAHFGVTEANWQDGAHQDRHFAQSETPCYVGRAVAALAADPNVKHRAGKVWSSGTLAKAYGFTDLDGRQPDFGAYFDRTVTEILDRGGAKDEDEQFLLLTRYRHVQLDPARQALAQRMAEALGISGAA